jgi:hypothetical protein
MLSAEEFIKRWGTGDDRLVRFPDTAVMPLALPEDCKQFLMTAGLPASAAPYLSFEAPSPPSELTRVSEVYSRLPDRFGRYRQIGSTGSGDPVALDEGQNGEVVYLNHDDGFRRILVNTCVTRLAECLLAYRRMVDDSNAVNGENWLDGTVPLECRAALERELRLIDPAAMQAGCMWADEVAYVNGEPPQSDIVPQRRGVAAWVAGLFRRKRRR